MRLSCMLTHQVKQVMGMVRISSGTDSISGLWPAMRVSESFMWKMIASAWLFHRNLSTCFGCNVWMGRLVTWIWSPNWLALDFGAHETAAAVLVVWIVCKSLAIYDALVYITRRHKRSMRSWVTPIVCVNVKDRMDSRASTIPILFTRGCWTLPESLKLMCTPIGLETHE